MAHGDAHHIVGAGNGLLWQAVALGAHHYSQSWLSGENRGVERDGLIGQRHRHSLEAQRVEALQWCGEPSPRNKEHRAHRHPHGAAVQRVARGGREQHGIDAQGCRRAKDGANVGSVGNTVNHHYSTGIAAHLLNRLGQWAPHGTQHAASEHIARELRQQLALTSIDGNIATPLNDGSRVALDVTSLTQQRKRLIASPQRHVNHLGTLGNKNALFGLEAVAQLRLGQSAKHLHPTLLQRCYLDYCHRY